MEMQGLIYDSCPNTPCEAVYFRTEFLGCDGEQPENSMRRTACGGFALVGARIKHQEAKVQETESRDAQVL
jgi:hypothetical protein